MDNCPLQYFDFCEHYIPYSNHVVKELDKPSFKGSFQFVSAYSRLDVTLLYIPISHAIAVDISHCHSTCKAAKPAVSIQQVWQRSHVTIHR